MDSGGGAGGGNPEPGTQERMYSSVLARSAARFKPECELAEEAIASSFALFSELARGVPKGDERAQDLLALFYRNCVYLSASYQLVTRGLLDPAGNNLRTVFETIVWQYAYLTDEGMYANFRAMNAMDGDKLRLIREGGWSNTKERQLENLRRKFSFQKAMKKLYSKGHYEKFFFSQYWALCQKSHSSIYGINHNTPNMAGGTALDSPGGEEEMRGNLSALLYLCAENLTCALNCFSAGLMQARIDRALETVNRINRAIPPSLSLAPDTLELPFMLRFREV
jgi:hypothetical protein